MDIFETVFVRNNLIVAFAVIGAIMWVSYFFADKLTAGRIHGSAIAIALGLLAAYWGGVTTGGSTGVADVALLGGIGLMGGGMMRDFAIVATAFGVHLSELKKAGIAGVISIFAGVIVSFTDLTEMARMRQELQQQDRLAVVGELAAGLAHEIRNPVAAIRSSVDEIRDNLETPDLLQKLSAIALRSSDHLDEIVTGFLNFARKPIKRTESFSVKALVLEVRDQLARKYQDAGELRIVVHGEEEVGQILGDRTQIWQVFMNLGQNAVEAMSESGQLDITMKVKHWIILRLPPFSTKMGKRFAGVCTLKITPVVNSRPRRKL